MTDTTDLTAPAVYTADDIIVARLPHDDHDVLAIRFRPQDGECPDGADWYTGRIILPPGLTLGEGMLDTDELGPYEIISLQHLCGEPCAIRP